MDTAYKEAFQNRLRHIAPEADPSALHLLPADIGRAALREILETGCLSQNVANIQLARQAVALIDPDWLTAALPQVVPQCLFQDPDWQEWELRRLSEMLQGPCAVRQLPAAFRWLTEYAKTLRSPEVDAALREISGELEYE